MKQERSLEFVHCRNCEKKLARIRGSAEIKCTRCGTKNYYDNTPVETSTT